MHIINGGWSSPTTRSQLTMKNLTLGSQTPPGVASSDLTFHAHHQWLLEQPNNKKSTDNEKPDPR